ncbi:DNA repair protein RecN (Recombination protein N) [Sphingobacterium nematocida]|uniref:DNA repair protein RecN n=1 Tax=Sphingobacterium nematocida TaxID=1513896 RepID=A0A1T5BIK3_9SPHI|nr:DNA repair protein RecN [Sphingobacterium nematocida]SKB47124.1 DNA repair protein RecN (Recombination protein N) [Sphingobacterium nematocida]
MLVRLLIKNYALIDSLDISFDKGLNIITGETGAGKSILMGALGLILGSRVEGRPFFDEQKKCVIEGYFNVAAYDLKRFFNDEDLDYEEETIIRREIALDGKSRAFVNDSPVTLATLKGLGEKLIDIHSQHATMQVNTEEFQLFVLDSLAANEDRLLLFREELKGLRTLDKQLKTLQEELDNANAESDYNQFLYDELEKVNVQAGEVKELEAEQQQLANAEEIKRGLNAASYALVDGEQTVLSMLKESINQVQHVGRYFGDAALLGERMQSAFIELKDVASELVAQEGSVHLNEQRLDEVNTRLSDVYALLKKHRVDSELELIQIKDQLESKLQLVLNQDQAMEELIRHRKVQADKVLVLGTEIHEQRKLIIPRVEVEVQQTLSHVGMPNAQLNIELNLLPFDKAGVRGMNSVQFLFSANKGQSMQPIHRVASGGELSRVMLAIKSLVAKSSALPSIIFDEIDTGISGEVALRVGEVMADLAAHMQVIAISHLPQIASKGQAHFKVYKEDLGEKTQSNIQLLTNDQRVVEIAQMLSGTNPGEAALQHAQELLKA